MPHIPNLNLSYCYEDGFRAYDDGAEVEDNPHTNPLGRRYWHDGWCAARDEATDGGQAVSTSDG